MKKKKWEWGKRSDDKRDGGGGKKEKKLSNRYRKKEKEMNIKKETMNENRMND